MDKASIVAFEGFYRRAVGEVGRKKAGLFRRCPNCRHRLPEEAFRQTSRSAPWTGKGGNLDEIWAKYGACCNKCAGHKRAFERAKKNHNWEPVISLEKLAEICEERRKAT